MATWHFIRDVLILLAAAGIVGAIFERFRQSAIVGYLVAGTLVGVLGGAQDRAIGEVAELGVTLLLFTIGLETSWRQFAAIGAIAAGGGSLQILVTVAVTVPIAIALGGDWKAGVALGAIIALSSTATVLRILTEKGMLDSQHGRASLGILLFQDLAVVPLVVLVTFLGPRANTADILSQLGSKAGLAAGLIIAVVIVANLVLPRLLSISALRRNRELPVVLAVVSWLAATWAAHHVGLSPALGAFVAGMIVAESPFARQIRSDVAPLRIIFVTLFFASIGILADLNWLLEGWNLARVLALVAAIIIGKAVTIWLIVSMFRRASRAAWATGFSLAQIGEFSFVLASIAFDSQLLNSDLMQLIVTSTLITLLLTPMLAGNALPIATAIDGIVRSILPWIGRDPADVGDEDAHEHRSHIVVAGYGPAGQGVVEALRNTQHDVVVIDLNPRLAGAARSANVHAIIGNAAQQEILEHAHLATAKALVIALPDHQTACDVIHHARQVSPGIRIIARARYHAFVDVLRRAGADVVVDEEKTVAGYLGAEIFQEVANGTRL